MEFLNLLVILLVAIAFSIAVASYAESKGRSWIGYFLLSIFLSPIVGLLFAWAANPQLEKVAERKGLKKCPDCAEWIQQAARKCRFCGQDLPVTEVDPLSQIY